MSDRVVLEVSVPEEYLDLLINSLRNFNSVNSDEVTKPPVEIEGVYKKKECAIIPKKNKTLK